MKINYDTQLKKVPQKSIDINNTFLRYFLFKLKNCLL